MMRKRSDLMRVVTLPVGPLQVNCHLVGCEQSRKAAVIDPGGDGARILAKLQAEGWTLEKIINTHCHFDHVGGNAYLVEQTGAELAVHQGDLPLLRRAGEHAAMYGLDAASSPEPSLLLTGGETIAVGSFSFKVVHIPGHSPGGICLVADGHVFSGDCLFAGSVGRTDLPGGDHNLLIEGIRRHLLILPDETIVHPGHGPDTTIGREKKVNPFL
jgi:hydroxyacylglutathione hydrolase